MNTIHYLPRIGCYMQQLESSMQTASRSLQPFLLGSLGDRPSDRPRYSVGNNRRSAQRRSQILLLSTATTSIYWSSRLDRSDQLQQSSAVRLDGLQCMWRHTTIWPRRECFPPAYSTCDTTVYLPYILAYMPTIFGSILTFKLWGSAYTRVMPHSQSQQSA